MRRRFTLVYVSIDTTVEFGGQSHPMQTMNMIAAAEGIALHDPLSRTWEDLDYRLDMCKATNEANIETYLTPREALEPTPSQYMIV